MKDDDKKCNEKKKKKSRKYIGTHPPDLIQLEHKMIYLYIYLSEKRAYSKINRTTTTRTIQIKRDL